MSKITVIDSKPGKGKTSFAIQMMKERYDDKSTILLIILWFYLIFIPFCLIISLF